MTIKKNTNQQEELRRQLLTGALFGFVGMSLAACDDDETNAATGAGGAGGSTNGGGGGPIGGAGSPNNTGGNGVGGTGPIAMASASLEALLNAEYRAINTYTAGAGIIGAAPDTDPLKPLADTITAVALRFQSQHKDHSDALKVALRAALAAEGVAEADVEGRIPTDATFEAPEELAVEANKTIENVLILALNAEKNAAVAYTTVVKALMGATEEMKGYRFLANSIGGDESQHFIVLAALALSLAAPGPNVGADDAVGKIVPKSFVSTIEALSAPNGEGLNTIANYFN